ncbi:RagB/SusD family nutrient uptake outer membrane protein [Hymenobacter sp. GOD-10R]|uniref:RagB/SusD family nutrient uptake outer membrane protein n=1 Tax=Hymenobacter sp. GOD-10R TaxID=3093922 RepID=UPI002D766FC9|nr:RagB/SusD family nutrient uptake outer membrane protein [Hymenobacter sp. GOD-10R]WRQ30595.1 RagB/SusD family nutrient uptake outer membrane protein [Hymenobacter sp. GOD-10R]
MKIHKVSTLLLASMLFWTTGCEKDLLDQSNPNAPTVENFWQTADDASKGVIAAYSGVQLTGIYGRMWHFATIPRSDEAYSQSPYTDLANYTRFLQTNYNFEYTQFMWNDYYRGVFRANQVLTRVPAIAMDETLKKQVIGEATFLRSLLYFDLAHLFGNVPMPLTESTSTARFPQASREQVLAQITADLEAVKPNMPVSYTGADRYRVTRGAVAALLGKVYMQQNEWAKAAAQFDEIIKSGQYALTPNYLDNFTAANENNSESIFEIQYSDALLGAGQDNSSASEGCERAQFFGPPVVTYSDVQPRRWIYDEFNDLTRDGKPDPRRDITMFSATSTDPLVYGQTYAQRGYNTSQLYWRKYQNDRTRTFENFVSPINFRVIRYADVLLMQAEALNEMKQTAAALALVNQVRNRVNLALLTGSSTYESMKAQIRHERVTELSGEGTRWTDINRYGLLKNQAGVNELKARDADFNNFVIGKSDLLPLPQSDTDLDKNLVQNPGW